MEKFYREYVWSQWWAAKQMNLAENATKACEESQKGEYDKL